MLLILGCLLPATGFERVCLWIANLDGGSGANETLVLQAMPPPLLVMLLCECELAMVPGVVLAVLLVGMTTTVQYHHSPRLSPNPKCAPRAELSLDPVLVMQLVREREREGGDMGDVAEMLRQLQQNQHVFAGLCHPNLNLQRLALTHTIESHPHASQHT